MISFLPLMVSVICCGRLGGLFLFLRCRFWGFCGRRVLRKAKLLTCEVWRSLDECVLVWPLVHSFVVSCVRSAMTLSDYVRATSEDQECPTRDATL
jgi:hypothetical protein